MQLQIGFNPLWNSSLHQDTIHNFILKHDLCDIYGVITGPVCLCTQAFFFARCNPGLRSWLDQKVLIGSKGHLHSMYHLLGKKTDFLLLSHCSNIEEIWNHHSFKDYGSKTNIMYLTDFWICNLMTTYGDHQYIRSTKGLGWWI